MTIQLIEEGILEKDWNKVIAGFNSITGKDLSKKEASKPKKRVVKKAVKKTATKKAITKKPTKKTTPKKTVTEQTEKTNESFIVIAKEVPKHKNTFHDDGSLFREDIEIDRLLTKGIKYTSRNRRPNVKQVRCTNCGKTETVPTILAPMKTGSEHETDYYCNDCNLSRGS